MPCDGHPAAADMLLGRFDALRKVVEGTEEGTSFEVDLLFFRGNVVAGDGDFFRFSEIPAELTFIFSNVLLLFIALYKA